jgi:hypothetical protein
MLKHHRRRWITIKCRFRNFRMGTPVYATDYGIATNFTIGGELSYQSTKFWSRSREIKVLFWNSSKWELSF